MIARRRANGDDQISERLRLVEALLSTYDLTACVVSAMEWLERTWHVRRALCLARVHGNPVFRTVGWRGFEADDAVSGFTFSSEDQFHPLARVLRKRRQTHVQTDTATSPRRAIRTPFGSDPFQAVPLRSGRFSDEAVGLLMIDDSIHSGPELEWFALVLAQKMENLVQAPAIGVREQETAHERSLLLSIINALPDPILLSDTEGRMVLANPPAVSLFHVSEEESEGRRDAVRLNNMLMSAALSSLAIGRIGTNRRELTLVSPVDGSDLLFELLNVVTDDARSGTGVLSILRNVSDLSHAMVQFEENNRRLKLAEAEARAERDRLNLVIDSVADPIVVTDAGGSISLVNDPAERLFTSRDAAKPSVQRRVRTNDARFSSFVAGLLVKDEVRRVEEISLVDPESGEPLPVEAIAGKVMTQHGEITAIVSILHDRREAIERARLYEQLKQGAAELERKVQLATMDIEHQNDLLRQQALALTQASLMKTQFLSNMSHEFRTPLNAILGYTSILHQGVAGKLGREAKEQLERIASNGRHLLTIVNEILDISQIEAGRMPVRVTKFRLSDMIDEVRAELEPIVRTAGLGVSIDIPDGLPRVATDRQKLKQVLLNLMTNAVKFTPKGEVGIRVKYHARPGSVEIAVTDTGIGIADGDQERIFDDFQQLDNSSTRAYSGTGLGLAICRRFVRMLRGNISVSSRVGAGSTFTVTIPVRTS
jgi:PAS domain S-box-containing protein